MPAVFSDEWARAWCAALNSSEAYRTAAAEWEGSVALKAVGEGEPQAVFLDLHRGACREARAATAGDLEAAAFVIEAQPAVWRSVLDARTSPVMALLTGRLKLSRGELARLVPHANSAKELLHLAAAVETEFPDGW